jgi:photosystem II stability/assembly factor-like uncharacterized protein
MDELILGTRKGLLITDRAGRLKREFHLGVPVSYAANDPRTGTWWAAVDHGHWGQKLHRSQDGGVTWDEIEAPKYPEGEVIYNQFAEPGAANATKPATVSYIWIVTPGGTDQPNRVYIGTEPGGLFASDDNGDHWYLVEGLWKHPSREKNWFGGGRDEAGTCSIIVDPRHSQHLFVGISVGGVFESHDGGQTWAGRNQGLYADFLPNPEAEYGHDPHFMVACPANPDVLWQQNHCGVFRTVDGAQTWTNVSQSNGGPVRFGFPIIVDDEDPDVAWVVPGISDELRLAPAKAMVVCRTDDGGQSWQEFRTGLPQQNAYDIVFRHAFDKRGDTLVFGSTTGSLYLSENRGETWRCLGQNYPPIYSVRFPR